MTTRMKCLTVFASAATGLLLASCSPISAPPTNTAPAPSSSTTAPLRADIDAYRSMDPEVIADYVEKQGLSPTDDDRLSSRIVAESFSGSRVFELPVPTPEQVVNYSATVACEADPKSDERDSLNITFETASGELVGLRGQACGALSVPTVRPPADLVASPGIVAVHVEAPKSTQVVLVVHDLTRVTE